MFHVVLAHEFVDPPRKVEQWYRLDEVWQAENGLLGHFDKATDNQRYHAKNIESEQNAHSDVDFNAEAASVVRQCLPTFLLRILI